MWTAVLLGLAVHPTVPTTSVLSSRHANCSFSPGTHSSGNLSCAADASVSGTCQVRVKEEEALTTAYPTVNVVTFPRTNVSYDSPNYLQPRGSVRVAVLAMGADGCRPLNESFSYVEEAGRLHADLILLPEEFSGTPDGTPPQSWSSRHGSSPSRLGSDANCSNPPQLPRLAESIDGPTISHLRFLAKKYKTNVIAPIRRRVVVTSATSSKQQQQQQQQFQQFNSQVAIDRMGKIIGTYDKIMPVLGPRGEEGQGYGEEGVTPGLDAGNVGVFHFDFGIVAGLTCFDVNFPELWERVRAVGPDLVVWPSAMHTPDPFIRAYATLLRVPILACGHPGEIVDGTGVPFLPMEKKLDAPNPWWRMTTADIDLDRTWVHGDNNVQKIDTLMKRYPDKISIDVAGPPHYLLRSVDPTSLSIRKTLKDNEMETLMAYTWRSRKGLNDIRSAGRAIGNDLQDQQQQRQHQPRDANRRHKARNEARNEASTTLKRGGGRCSDEMDCELLGECVQGVCVCQPGWTGSHCGTLRLLPADKERDIIWPLPTPKAGWPKNHHPISWGASLLMDKDGTEHLFAGTGCYQDKSGMHTRGFQIVHLSSDNAGDGPVPQDSTAEQKQHLGPFHFRDVALGQTRINPHIMRTEQGFAMFFVGYDHHSSNFTCMGAEVGGGEDKDRDKDEGKVEEDKDPPIPPGMCSNFNCYTASCQTSRKKCEHATGYPEWGSPCVWNNNMSSGGKCTFRPWESVFGLKVATSTRLEGPWHEQNLALKDSNGLNQGTNPSAVVLSGSGKVLLAYRFSIPVNTSAEHHRTFTTDASVTEASTTDDITDDEGATASKVDFYENVTEMIGIAVAPHWGGDFTKVGPPNVPISHHQAEDPFVWEDQKTGHVHIVAHDIIRLNAIQCNGSGWAGAHYFSADEGVTWSSSPFYPSKVSNCSDAEGFGPGAYHVNVTWTDGTATTYYRRERPEIVFDEKGRPAFFISGVELMPQNISSSSSSSSSSVGNHLRDQYSFTVVQRVDLSTL